MRASSVCLLAVIAGAGFAGTIEAQSPMRYTIEPAASLVWWQIDPHYNHLWATTCPDDPSWQPGEGRSPDFRYVFDPKFGDAGVPAKKIPLYERGPVRALCRSAVTGALMVQDTTSWRVQDGMIRVAVDSIVTGLNMRDAYAHRMLFETHAYPELRFRIDSVSSVLTGEGVRADVHGIFELRGVQRPVTVPVEVWREDDGTLRVMGQTQFPAQDLLRVYGMSRMKLGLGVAMRRWDTVHWGFDLVLRPVGN